MFLSRRRARPDILTTVGFAAASAAIAAAAVYLLDSQSGKQRRELLRDRIASASRKSYDMAAQIGRRSKGHLRSVPDSPPF